MSLPYSVHTNDVPAYFEMKVSVPEFEVMLRRHPHRDDPRVMAIPVQPFVSGQSHRIGALDCICSHPGVRRVTAAGRSSSIS